MATSSGDVASLPPEEAVELSPRTNAVLDGGADLTLSQEEAEIELNNFKEQQYSVRYTIPREIASLHFRRETVTGHEMNDAIRRRYQKRFKKPLDEIEPSEAFELLKQNEATTMLSWEMQVEESVQRESDNFWTQVSQ